MLNINYMKNILNIFLAAFFMLFTVVLSAQHCDGSGRADRGGFNMVEMLSKHLDLTAEQKISVKEIVEAQKVKIGELKQNSEVDTDRSEVRASILKIKEASKSEIAKVLTEEQLFVFNDLPKHGRHFNSGENCNGKDVKGKRAALKVKCLEMRIELEEDIARKDKRKIKALRKTMKAARAEKKLLFETLKVSGERPGKEELKAAMATIKAKYKADWNKVNALVEKYDANIQALFDKNEIGKFAKGACVGKRWSKGSCGAGKRAVKESLGKGKSDKACCSEEVRAACCPNGEKVCVKDDSASKSKACCSDEVKAACLQNGKKMACCKKGKMKARFLLMNPKGKGIDVTREETLEGNTSTLKVNPNPANSNATISYEVKNEGAVAIDLIDESGNLVKNLLDEFKTEGSYELKISTDDLKSKIYFIAIKDAKGVNNTKLMINAR